jgi:hypothetical protein
MDSDAIMVDIHTHKWHILNMKQVIKIFNSFEEAENNEVEYWKSLDPNKKLTILEEIRQRHMEITGEGKQGFQRVIKIIKQK